MPKSPSKVVEVVDDSEEEQAPKSKKKIAKVEKSTEEEVENADGNDDENEDEDEEEYEIESILDARHGAFPGGKMGYLVKWKGYSNEHNSWVVDDDAANAQDLINEFWEKQKRDKKGKSKGTGSRARPRKSETVESSQEPEEAPSSKKRRKSASDGRSKAGTESKQEEKSESESEKPQAKKPKVSVVKPAKEKKTPPPPPKEPNGMEVDSDATQEPVQYMPIPQKAREKKSWESLVQSIETIERLDGVLKVFFTMTNGDKVVESSKECAKRFPQKLIMFYEANLRWRAEDSETELMDHVL